jgi:hypothetical protein
LQVREFNNVEGLLCRSGHLNVNSRYAGVKNADRIHRWILPICNHIARRARIDPEQLISEVLSTVLWRLVRVAPRRPARYVRRTARFEARKIANSTARWRKQLVDMSFLVAGQPLHSGAREPLAQLIATEEFQAVQKVIQSLNRDERIALERFFEPPAMRRGQRVNHYLKNKAIQHVRMRIAQLGYADNG